MTGRPSKYNWHEFKRGYECLYECNPREIKKLRNTLNAAWHRWVDYNGLSWRFTLKTEKKGIRVCRVL